MHKVIRHIRDSTGEVLPLPARWLGSQDRGFLGLIRPEGKFAQKRDTSAAACFPVSSDHRFFFIKKIHIEMEKINQIIQLFAAMKDEERKAAAGMVRMADLLLDRLDQHGEIAVSSISQIGNKKNIVTVLEWMGFQLVTSCRATRRPGKKPMAWRKQDGHETV